MKICMMSCMLNGFSPREIVETAVLCRMTAVDWISLHNTAPEELRKISEDAGLKIAAHTMIKTGFLNGEKDYFDEFKRSLEDTVILGAPVLMLPPFPRKLNASMAEDRKAWIEYYAQACPLAQQAGVILTLESTGYWNSPITTGEEVLEVLRQVPGLKLTFDHGNTATADDPIKAYDMVKDYIVHVHLKDWTISDVRTSGESLKRCGRHYANALIGEGDMELRKFWDVTDENTRNCYVNLETCDFSGKNKHVEALQKVADHLRSW